MYSFDGVVYNWSSIIFVNSYMAHPPIGDISIIFALWLFWMMFLHSRVKAGVGLMDSGTLGSQAGNSARRAQPTPHPKPVRPALV